MDLIICAARSPRLFVPGPLSYYTNSFFRSPCYRLQTPEDGDCLAAAERQLIHARMDALKHAAVFLALHGDCRRVPFRVRVEPVPHFGVMLFSPGIFPFLFEFSSRRRKRGPRAKQRLSNEQYFSSCRIDVVTSGGNLQTAALLLWFALFVRPRGNDPGHFLNTWRGRWWPFPLLSPWPWSVLTIPARLEKLIRAWTPSAWRRGFHPSVRGVPFSCCWVGLLGGVPAEVRTSGAIGVGALFYHFLLFFSLASLCLSECGWLAVTTNFLKRTYRMARRRGTRALERVRFFGCGNHTPPKKMRSFALGIPGAQLHGNYCDFTSEDEPRLFPRHRGESALVRIT